MSEIDPSDEINGPLWAQSEASDFEVWESLEDLQKGIREFMDAHPRSILSGDEFYCVAFDMLDEEDDIVATAGYNYEGELVELVEDEVEPYVVFKDVCCFVLADGDRYEPKDREAYFRDTVFIARHTVMHVPISSFSLFMPSVRSKSEAEAEYAKFSSPADKLKSS